MIKSASLLASSYLQLRRKYFFLEQLGKWVPPLLLIPVLFLSLLFAADHSLHEKLHKDASQSFHQCAITIFEQQHVVASDPRWPLVHRADGRFDRRVGLGRSTPSADSPERNPCRGLSDDRRNASRTAHRGKGLQVRSRFDLDRYWRSGVLAEGGSGPQRVDCYPALQSVTASLRGRVSLPNAWVDWRPSRSPQRRLVWVHAKASQPICWLACDPAKGAFHGTADLSDRSPR